MKDYEFLPKCVIRIPILHRQEIDEDQIDKYLRDPLIFEAIYLSSPDLMNAYMASDEVTGKLKTSIWKYLHRMSTRCTPFGLMAGCSVVSWGQEDNLKFDSKNSVWHTRLDMQLILELTNFFLKKEEIKKSLRYFPNSSILLFSNRIRYVEHQIKNSRNHYLLTEVNCNSILEQVLHLSEGGAKYNDIVNLIVEEGFEEEESQDYLNTLIESKILTSELDIGTTGVFPELKLLDFLQKKHPTILNNGVERLLQKKSTFPFVSLREEYQLVEEAIKDTGISYNSNNLIQSNTYFDFGCSSISSRHKRSIKNVFKILADFYVAPKNLNLTSFISAFTKKYDQQFVPLQEVMDHEIGIGYPPNSKGTATPFVDNVNTASKKRKFVQNVEWNEKKNLLLKIIEKAQRENNFVIELEDFQENVKSLKVRSGKAPKVGNTYYVSFSLIKENNKELVFFKGASMNSSGIIGRFANDSESINNIYNEICEKQLRENEIVAEVIHLPEARVGNVLHRPAYTKFEIPYLGNSSVPREFQIPIQDLLISVRGDEVVLYSKKHQKRVHPVLSNAHNYSASSLPIYHFLCDLQYQGYQKSIFFNWEGLNKQFKRLPRVTYNNTIVSRAEWHFTNKELNMVNFLDKNEVENWRKENNVPTKVILVKRDLELLVDFTQSYSKVVFENEVRKLKSISLLEFLFDKELQVKDEHDRKYTNEIIAFLFNNNESPSSSGGNVFSEITTNKVKRKFSIGSEWLYYKIYCGPTIAEKIILRKINIVTQRCRSRIKKWFYIRYFDEGGHHLRFRIQLDNIQDYSYLLAEINAEFQADLTSRMISNIQLDTYVREIERYGSLTIVSSESMFHFDSECVLEITELLDGQKGETYRWLYGLLSIDFLLQDFGFSLNAKRNLLEKLKEGFAREFGVDKTIRKQMSEIYLNNKSLIFDILNLRGEISIEMEPAIELLNIRSTKNKQVIPQILDKTDKLTSLMSSYIHMICNRLFVDKQRKHELLIYDYLYKFYQTTTYLRKNKE